MNDIDVLYITCKEACKRYGYSKSWFSQARSAKKGPPYVKAKKKILYPVAEADAWFKKSEMIFNTNN